VTRLDPSARRRRARTDEPDAGVPPDAVTAAAGVSVRRIVFTEKTFFCPHPRFQKRKKNP
jgi:hypothetical protein